MPAGASAKREREYVKLERQFRKEHRYPGREEEVAARIVNKQRRQFGETTATKQKEREGKPEEKGAPIDGYQHMTIPQILARVDHLSKAEIRKIRNHESRHKNRKGLMSKLDSLLSRA